MEIQYLAVPLAFVCKTRKLLVGVIDISYKIPVTL
jgi:hypothetical protein